MKSRARPQPSVRNLPTRHFSIGRSRVSRAPVVKKILVPLDFSNYSNAALSWALTFAEQFRARVVLLYVAETIPAGSELGACHLPQLEADLRKIGRRQLSRIKKSEIPPGVASQCLIRAGKADVEIVETAKSLNVELIVMAAHSQGSQHGQLGSTCERVTRFAPCPVLLVPAHEQTVPFFL